MYRVRNFCEFNGTLVVVTIFQSVGVFSILWLQKPIYCMQKTLRICSWRQSFQEKWIQQHNNSKLKSCCRCSNLGLVFSIRSVFPLHTTTLEIKNYEEDKIIFLLHSQLDHNSGFTAIHENSIRTQRSSNKVCLASRHQRSKGRYMNRKS